MSKGNFYKVVCETVDVFGKTILLDENCKNLDDVHRILISHPDLQKTNVTWILYPMTI